MPVYEYECQSCGRKLEIMQKHSDMPVSECPDCKGSMRKLISNTSFVLKGTGWYKTDYPSSTAGSPGETKKHITNAGETPVQKTETKTETKTEVKSEVKPEAKQESASNT